jgi:hypothetical protein
VYASAAHHMVLPTRLPCLETPGGVCTVTRKVKDVACQIFLSSVCIGLTGCTTVRIESGPDTVKIERHFGALYVSVADAGQARVAQVRSLGLTSTPLGFSAGYTHQMIVQMPPDGCQLVLWVGSEAQLAEARRLVADAPKACVVSDFSPSKEE